MGTQKQVKLCLSVVIPALNAARGLPGTLDALGSVPSDIVVVDGGSGDGTINLARERGVRVLMAPRGRGAQLAIGCAMSREAWLLLLHADTQLASGWEGAVSGHMQASADRAGYFRFALDSESHRARRLERMVAWRCRALALPYGDQGLLIHRALLDAIGGVRPMPLMEDVDLVRRLGRRRLVCLDADAVTAATKWEREGWHRRSLRNLFCLSLYLAGIPPRLIARIY